jgi:hypothetical protein
MRILLGCTWLLTALATGLPTNAAETQRVIGTETQLSKEKLALRILERSEPLRREKEKLRQAFANDPRAATPSGRATLEMAVDSLTLMAAFYAVNEDPDRPEVTWISNARHQWFGLDVPDSGFGLPNADNVYRIIPIDGDARYEIHGKAHPPSAQQIYSLFLGIPGYVPAVMAKEREESPILAQLELIGLETSKMDIKSDGTFTITVDSDPPNGRQNHIQTRAGNRGMEICIRDTLSDWTTQSPVSLNVVRVSGPPVRPALTPAELEKRAAEILSSFGPYWLNWGHKSFATLAANAITPPYARRTGWGFTTIGKFALEDDSAWVVTLDPLGAAYLGFTVYDPWAISGDYVTRSGSLNQAQAKANRNGTYTFIVAAKDPRAYNWLDTGGLSSGTFQIRWQRLPAGVTSGAAGVTSIQMIKLKDLKEQLPEGTAFVTPDQRNAEIAARIASYNRRLH